MQIFIKDFNNTILALDVEPSDKIVSLKGIIKNILGYFPSLQDLTFSGQILNNFSTLTEYQQHFEASMYHHHLLYYQIYHLNSNIQ